MSTIQNVVLDLDETLISAIEIDEIQNEANLAHNFKHRSPLFKYHLLDKDYVIFERPGVQEFLDFLFQNYNVSVWTAASKDYALFVVDKVFLHDHPERKLDFICYARHCDESKTKTGCLKQLNNLFHLHKYTPANTVIIDDNSNVLSQKNNCIKARSFNFTNLDSHEDKYLNGTIRKKLVSQDFGGKSDSHSNTNNNPSRVDSGKRKFSPSVPSGKHGRGSTKK
jgi:hypothetical protein